MTLSWLTCSARALGLATLGLLAACSPIEYERNTSPVTAEQPESIYGIKIPDSPMLREPFTKYLQVKDGEKVVGYMVRYEEVPSHIKNVQRSYPTGSVFVENTAFERIGFVTIYGTAYQFHPRGSDPIELGKGTLTEVAPLYFGGSDLSVSTMQ